MNKSALYVSNFQGKGAAEVVKLNQYCKDSANIAKLSQNCEYYQDWLFGCAKAAGELNAKLKIAIVLNNLGLASSCAEPLILQSKSQQTHISRIHLAHIISHYPHLFFHGEKHRSIFCFSIVVFTKQCICIWIYYRTL